MTTGAKYERDLVNAIRDKTSWEAKRSTGSQGLDDVSLFAPFRRIYFLVEMKSTKYSHRYGSKEEGSQYDDILNLVEKGFPYIYIVRWKSKTELRGASDMERMEVYSPLWSNAFKFQEGITLPDFIRAVNRFGAEFDVKTFLENKDKAFDMLEE